MTSLVVLGIGAVKVLGRWGKGGGNGGLDDYLIGNLILDLIVSRGDVDSYS
jgi:hypothetical protein